MKLLHITFNSRAYKAIAPFLIRIYVHMCMQVTKSDVDYYFMNIMRRGKITVDSKQ